MYLLVTPETVDIFTVLSYTVKHAAGREMPFKAITLCSCFYIEGAT